MPSTTHLRPDTSMAEPATAPTGPAPTTLGRRRSSATDDQPILSIRADVSKASAAAFIADALRDVRTYMQEHHVTAAGPPFSICRAKGDTVDIEAGWPTDRQVTGTSRIHSGALPNSLTHCRRPDPPDTPENPR